MSTFLDEEWSWKTLSLWKYLEEGNIPSHWQEFFFQDKVQQKLQEISKHLEEEKKTSIIYPPINRVFRAFFLNPKKIRVVILGQDPYHNGNAVGLCFSVPTKAGMNPSLVNIYNELESEGYVPKRDGNLQKWADQGVFLINTALTVNKGDAGSHTKYWYSFTEMLVSYLCESNIVWLLMGKDAIEFSPLIKKGKTVSSSHPSPLSAHRPYREHPAFIGSGVFRKVNDFLEKKIIW